MPRLAALLLLLATTFAQADDRIIARAYVDDSSGLKTLEQVRQMPAKPFSGVLSRGFTRSSTWLRLSVAADPHAQPGDTLVLRIRPTYLDQLELHDPLDSSGRVRRAGDQVEWNDAEVKSLSHGFVIPASTEPRQIWLRLVTTSSSFVHVELISPDEFHRTNQIQEMIYGLMLGVLLLFLLWALLHWLLWRETMVAMFGLTQLIAVVYSLTLLGYTRVLFGMSLTAAAVQIISNMVFCSYVLVSLLFHYVFLREFQPAKLLHRPIRWIALSAFVIEMALLSSGESQQALHTNAIVVSLAPLLLFATAVSCKAWQDAATGTPPVIPRWAFLLFYVLVCSVVVLASSHSLGLLNAPELNLHLHLVHGLLTGSVLIAILQVRALRNEAARNLATVRARSAAQQIEIEREKTQLQGRFMEMLAHELKTALSVLQMVLGTPQPTQEMLAHGRRTLQDVNDLIDRCLLAQQFDDGLIVAEFDQLRADELIEEILRKLPEAARLAVYYETRISLRSDRELLRSVLSNLLDNALKYSTSGSVIQVKLRPASNQGLRGCEFTVENEVERRAGVPAPLDEAELFKKYYRAESALRHTGSGLGLYLVAGFVKLLGGTVRCETEEFRVKFTVWLPN